MMRTYNEKLSARVNAQLDRREHTVRIQKRLLAIAGILFISIMILLGSSIRAFASSHSGKQPVYKYYCSVAVERGDTLWTLADKYIAGYDVDKVEYIQEVCELNHLSDGEIHAGEYLIMGCYSTEKR